MEMSRWESLLKDVEDLKKQPPSDANTAQIRSLLTQVAALTGTAPPAATGGGGGNAVAIKAGEPQPQPFPMTVEGQKDVVLSIPPRLDAGPDAGNGTGKAAPSADRAKQAPATPPSVLPSVKAMQDGKGGDGRKASSINFQEQRPIRRLSDAAVRELAKERREAIRQNDLQRIERIRNADDAYSDKDRRRIEETVPKVGPDGTWRRDAVRALEGLWGKGDDGLKDARAKIALGFEDPEQRRRIEAIAGSLAKGVLPANPEGFRYVPTEHLEAALTKNTITQFIFNAVRGLQAIPEPSSGSAWGRPGGGYRQPEEGGKSVRLPKGWRPSRGLSKLGARKGNGKGGAEDGGLGETVLDFIDAAGNPNVAETVFSNASDEWHGKVERELYRRGARP